MIARGIGGGHRDDRVGSVLVATKRADFSETSGHIHVTMEMND